MKFSEALKELRQGTRKRNFDQTLDLIVNLRDFDMRRESLNTSAILPFLNKPKKVAAFLERSSAKADYVVTKGDLDKIELSEIKTLAQNYDFFIASAKLMPTIASKFGKVLGTLGKMPDPKLGCVIMQESEDAIGSAVEKLSKTTKIKAKEPSLKIAIGKESMPDEQLEKNAETVLNAIIPALAKGEQNIRSVMLKFTMGKPVKVKK
jgi:large subunit ribosomal protein L1